MQAGWVGQRVNVTQGLASRVSLNHAGLSLERWILVLDLIHHKPCLECWQALGCGQMSFTLLGKIIAGGVLVGFPPEADVSNVILQKIFGVIKSAPRFVEATWK